jgi:hypothetical protein
VFDVLDSTLPETCYKSVHQLIHFVEFAGKITPGNQRHLETTFIKNKKDESWKLKKILFPSEIGENCTERCFTFYGSKRLKRSKAKPRAQTFKVFFVGRFCEFRNKQSVSLKISFNFNGIRNSVVLLRHCFSLLV